MSLNIGCSFNKNHFVCKDPVVLICQSNNDLNNQNRFACHKCIIEKSDYMGMFDCSFCNNQHNKNELINNQPADQIDLYKTQVKEQLKDIYFSFNRRHDIINAEIKERFKTDRNLMINNLFDYLELDIEVRVESIKVELEKLRIKLNTQVDNFYSKAKYINSENIKKIQESENKLKVVNDNNKEEHCKIIESVIYKLESLENLNESNKSDEGRSGNIATNMPTKLRSCTYVANKKLSLPTKSMIGILNSLPNKDFNSNSKPKVEVLDLRSHLKSACSIAETFDFRSSKYTLAISDFASNNIKIFENNYDGHLSNKDIKYKCINVFRQTKFKEYYAICSDTNFSHYTDYSDADNLYVCDMELLRILIFNLSLTKLKRIIKTTGPSDNKLEFQCPRDIFYFDNQLYVLDQGRNCIDIFSKHGDFLKHFYFNSALEAIGAAKIEDAWSVRATVNTIAVIDWKKKIFLFDFHEKLKRIIDQVDVLSMCFVSRPLNLKDISITLFLHCENGDFLGYKLEDEKEPHLIVKEYFKELKCRSEFMIFSSANQKFVISLGWNKSLGIVHF